MDILGVYGSDLLSEADWRRLIMLFHVPNINSSVYCCCTKTSLKQSTFVLWQEKRLCSEMGLPPPFYLKMEEVISIEIFSGNVTKRSDAHHLFKIEPSKIDRVYDMLVKRGLHSLDVMGMPGD
ncbi:putative transcription regulator Homeodomain-LIKE family [Rosa chinensis]|uniref:Putative transcription regulator Homeodomain-LIKE family n=1 Tax=Rosa chinensis TaxID=74649 RepID=A0A2P6SKI9_ROSCH|nr:putative transcription regulator Homeodomain-LIKE family [Rosa chinensis]